MAVYAASARLALGSVILFFTAAATPAVARSPDRNLHQHDRQQVAMAEEAIAPGRASSGLKALVARHAAENGVPFALADAVVKIESGYNPRARNRSGAMGLMQIKAQTARGQGFGGSSSGLLDPDTNLRFAMRYLATAYRMSGGDVCGTVMRYQSGHFARHMSGADRSYCGRARRLMAQA